MGRVEHQNPNFDISTWCLVLKWLPKVVPAKIWSIFKMADLLKATPEFSEIFRKKSPVGLLFIPKKSPWINE